MSPSINTLFQKYRSLPGLLLLVLVVLAYWPITHGGFIWDDDLYLTRNPLILAADGLHRFWFTTQPLDYYPLSSTSLWLEWRVWGLTPTGYHWTNVLLHALSAVLLWRCLERLRVPGAWFAAALFAVHPVNVQAVGWIAQRKSVLAMLFGAMALLGYLRSDEERSKSWYAFSLLAFLAALLSKTSVVMLPCVMLLCAWWQWGRIGKRDVFRVLPFFCIALVMAAVTVWFQYTKSMAGVEVRTDGWPGRIAGSGWAAFFYLYKGLWPFQLSYIYPRWNIPTANPAAYLPLLGTFLVLAAGWYKRDTWGRGPLVTWASFLLLLFPVLGFLDIGFMTHSFVADHWQYVALPAILAGITGGFTVALRKASPSIRTTATVLGVLLLAGLSVLTALRCYTFQKEERLWLHTARLNPASWQPHFSLGTLYLGRGDLAAAEKELLQAREMNADEPKLHANLGVLYAMQDNPQEAVIHLQRAHQLDPDNPNVVYNLGRVNLALNNVSAAAKYHRDALRLRPQSLQYRNNLAWLLATASDPAVRQPEEAIKLATEINEWSSYQQNSFLDTLAAAQAAAGQFEQAVTTAEKALNLARQAGLTDQAGAIEKRLAGYRQRIGLRGK